MTTLAAALAEARAKFSAAGLADAAVEARLLLGGLLELSSTEMFVRGDRVLTAEDQAKINHAVARRLQREPVHRILGRRDFQGSSFLLSRETLEPRPDTETLVECILDHACKLDQKNIRILDLGTGTGAIVLSLLKALPEASGVGSDISQDALDTACTNARELGVDSRFSAVQSSWFSAISGRFDIIVSNPPYIRSDIIPVLEPEVRDFDPMAALDGGPDGLDAYRAIAQGAEAFLNEGGYIGLEIGFDQKEMVTAIFQDAGFTFAQARRDYGGNDRVLLFAGPSFDVAC
jgi:release factor glutamine methyltransferase